MTMPSGAAGLDAGFDDWGITSGASTLATRSQANVETFYKGQVAGSDIITTIISGFWDGIMSGFQTLNDLLGQIIQAITGAVGGTFSSLSSFINDIVSGLGDAITFIQNVLDAIISAIRGIPFVGGTVADVLSDVTGLNGRANNAQTSADTANVGLAILTARVNNIISGGAVLWDTFDRNVADIASDPAYDVAYAAGPGSMELSTASSGVARWLPVGYSDASFVARDVTTPMTTNFVRVSTVIDDFIYGSAGNQAHIMLMGRMSAARDTYVVGIVEDGLAEIGYVVSGVYTRMGGQETISTFSGDLWDLEIGALGDEWRFRLLQNNAVRVDRTDLGHASSKDTVPGTTYIWTAFGGDCAIGAGFFGTTYQIGMPNFQVFAAADY